MEFKRKFEYELRGIVKPVPRCIWEIESLYENYFVVHTELVSRDVMGIGSEEAE